MNAVSGKAPDQHAGRATHVLLRSLLTHALTTTPYYEERLAGLDIEAALEPDGWLDLPVLTRADLQKHGGELTARSYPKQHGAVSQTRSSGSTGRPVTVLHTQVSANWHNALSFRAQLWAHRRFDLPLAAIRYYKVGVGDYPDGFAADHWADDLTLPSVVRACSRPQHADAGPPSARLARRSQAAGPGDFPEQPHDACARGSSIRAGASGR